MKAFASSTLLLKKDVRQGDTASLLSLFDPDERFKVLSPAFDADEGTVVRVLIGDLAEVSLALGADMRAGRKKNIMTMFWYAERARLFTLRQDAARGQALDVRLVCE